jgi:hypothetical protein
MGKFDNLTEDEAEAYKAESAQRTNEPSPEWEQRSKQLTRDYEALSAGRDKGEPGGPGEVPSGSGSADDSAGNASQQ